MAMRRIELQEYEQYREDVPLDKAQIAGVEGRAHVDVTPSTDEEGKYILTPSSYVGALNVGELAVVIRPKIDDRPRHVPNHLRDGPQELAQGFRSGC